MAEIERLLTRPERERAAKARVALDALRDVDDLPASVAFPVLRALQKAAAPRQGKPDRKPFAMITPETINQTVQAIRDLPGKDRPHTVALAFMSCLGSLDWDNGRILLSREDLAQQVGVAPEKMSEAMNVLVRLGVILKDYEQVPGMRGRGRVIYAVNPHVAWKGDGQNEARAEHPKPSFQVIRGGDTGHDRP